MAADRWEVFWCMNAWWDYADRLEQKLPAWASLRRVDPSKPLAEQVGNADVLIPTTAPCGSDVIAAARKLKLVVNPAAAYHHIAVEDCRARGVPVCRTAEANSISTAEAAVCCMMMLAKRVDAQRNNFRKGILGEPLAWELHGKTLGIVGLGSIGKHVAKVAGALGMRILATSSKSSEEDLEHLLRSSHVVSLHCPLTPQTRGLIGRTQLEMMKPGALLINYARGHVVDEEAVTEALLSGRLGGLGLDVHWAEPEDPDKPLYAHPNVVSFPHSGASTDAVLDRCTQFIVDNLVASREGRPLRGQLALPTTE